MPDSDEAFFSWLRRNREPQPRNPIVNIIDTDDTQFPKMIAYFEPENQGFLDKVLQPKFKDVRIALLDNRVTTPQRSAADTLNTISDQMTELLTRVRKLEDSQRDEIVRLRAMESGRQAPNYYNGFYMSAGLSALGGILGLIYFGGYAGVLLLVASLGPFLMSLLGLSRSKR